MRHGKKFNHLGRMAAHRKAMLANMACSLIEHKRIKTTLAKAKALRMYMEPLITKSKNDTTHSRRVVFSYLKQKEAKIKHRMHLKKISILFFGQFLLIRVKLLVLVLKLTNLFFKNLLETRRFLIVMMNLFQ